MVNKLKKAACFSDIHFGRKSNSDQHNQDCIDFITWFCDNVKNDPDIDHIVFMGDWHENRSALNISTLRYSYIGASMLSELGIPVYFCVGNHDLYYRHNREIHSLLHFKSLPNFILVEEPILVEETYQPVLMAPFMFHNEYPTLAQYLNAPIWMGHFEFCGFYISGYNSIMPVGPNAADFKEPLHIFSGHFHKRQAHGNVVYIGNTFPMDFSDAGDNARGMITYDYVNDDIEFVDWENCPKYIKTTLSALADGNTTLFHDARVKCIADSSFTYEEVNTIRQVYTERYKLRELVIEDSEEIDNVISSTAVDMEDSTELMSISDLMVQLLNSIETDHIDTSMLVEIYKTLKTAKG
jgi:DNA repair exonuclease SbcCD nuclease subunit